MLLTKQIPELQKEFKKGKFNPKEWLWQFEYDERSDNYSLYIVNKKVKEDYYAFDGAKTLGTVKGVGKLFNVQVKERKK